MCLFMVCKRCNEGANSLLLYNYYNKAKKVPINFLVVFATVSCAKTMSELQYVTTRFTSVDDNARGKSSLQVCSSSLEVFQVVLSCAVPELHARICIYLYEIISRINQMYQNKKENNKKRLQLTRLSK